MLVFFEKIFQNKKSPLLGVSWWAVEDLNLRPRPYQRRALTSWANRPSFDMVERQGLEPWTPCLQSRCSSQLSYVPINCQDLLIVQYLFNSDKCIINNMLYQFSFGSLFFGILVLIAGGIVVVFHQKLADNLGSGVSSYDRFKFWGLVTCGVGFAIMLSLHTIPLNWLLNSLFGGGL